MGDTQGEKVGVLHEQTWMEAEKAMTTYKRIAGLDQTKLLLLINLFTILERGALSQHSDCPLS